MNVAAILSRQDRRHVSNDYTIRLNNVFYQLLPPPVPGLRGGYVTVEKRLDGSLHIRLKGQYLKYKICGPTQALGALPPAPRSLAQGRIPAENVAEPTTVGEEGLAALTARPSAVHPAVGRSGRTPAEPYPPDGMRSIACKPKYRRPLEHPWNHFRLPGSLPRRTFLSSSTTGHS